MTERYENAIPQTDEQAIENLLGDNPSVSNEAAVGIYEIYRAKGESILEAYEHTLTTAIEAAERGRAKREGRG